MKLAKDFRASAREALAGKWIVAVIAAVIASLLGAAASGGSFSVSFGADLGVLFAEEEMPGDGYEEAVPGADEIIDEELSEADMAIFATIFVIIFGIALVFGILFGILGSIVGVGYAKFNLDLIDRKEECSVNSLFAYFKFWKHAVLASLLREVYVLLWTLLFIIPGIIAGYTYALVPYIMAESPELSAGEACAKSKELMRGNRWRLFCLEISFIGWSLLSLLTCGIGYYVLNPYMYAARADFYREISDTRPVIITEDDSPIIIPGM